MDGMPLAAPLPYLAASSDGEGDGDAEEEASASASASARAEEARELLVVGLGVGHAQAKQALHVARVPRQVEIHQRLFHGDKTTEGDVDAVSMHVEVWYHQ